MSALSSSGSTWQWRKIRAHVIERDRGICWICGKGGATSVDHVVPRARGGSDALTNLRAAHVKCNASRGARMALPTPSRDW